MFNLKENKTSIKQEVLAGFTTFATMAYVLIVHTNMMVDAGMNGTGVMLTTALISGLVTIIMGLYTKTPFALAPGMGTNAVLAYTLVAGGVCNWQTGLGMIFIEGVLFILLSLFKIREKVVGYIPKVLKVGVGAGVGAFLLRMAVFDAGFFTSAEGGSFALVSNFNDPAVLLAFIGLLITLTLYFIRININGRTYQIRGSLLISIFITTLIGIPMGVTHLPSSLITTGGFKAISDVAFKLDIMDALNPKYFAFIIIFFMGDFFSTLGTALGVGGKAEMLDDDGNLPMIGKVFLVDAGGTILGSLFGLTTVTTYVESASGVEAGGRTGLTAITTGVLFILSMLFAPIFTSIPTAATAPALVCIGISMMQTLKNVDFTDVEWYPTCIMVIVALFAGVAKAIGVGMVAYCVAHYAKFFFVGKENRNKEDLPFHFHPYCNTSLLPSVCN